MMKSLKWISVLLLVFSFSQVSVADDDMGERSFRKGQKILQKLDLSDDQRKQMKAIREKYREEMKSLRSKMKESRGKMKSLHTSGNESEILQHHKQAQETRNKLDDLRLQRMLETKKVLTPEQFSKMQEFRKKGKRGKRKGRRAETNDLD